MRRTTASDLLAPFFTILVIGYVLLRFTYDSLPPVDYGIGVPLLFLTIIEFLAARRVRAAVGHDPDAKVIQAIVIARLVALGKASALVGAGLLGAVSALLLRVAPDAGRVKAAGSDLRVGIVLFAVCGLLLAAGIVLERSGIDPGRSEQRRSGPPAAAA
jgi:hypothetical protein